METLDQIEVDSISIENQKASKSTRFANLVIDMIVAIVLGIIAFIILDILNPNSNVLADENQESSLLTYVIFFLYFFLIETLTKGKSIGKLITKSTVVLKDGSPATIKTYFLRSIGRFIPFDAISYFGKSGIHDLISSSIVIKDRK